MSRLLSLADLPANLAGRVAFVRVDFNVPLHAGEVVDTTRIEAAIPTLEELSRRGARVLCASHCGRPGGERQLEWSLAPVAPVLGRIAGSEVRFVDDCIGAAVAEAVAASSDGDLLLLENLRFYPGETSGDEEFAANLAEPADLFVGEAFGTAHRDHASVTGVARRVDDRAAGELMHREVTALTALLDAPAKPFVLVMGGAKMSGKIETLENLLPLADRVLLGGGIANTFAAGQGADLGSSLVESEKLETARSILADADRRGVEVLVPTDATVTSDLSTAARVRECSLEDIATGEAAVDIGPHTLRRYREALEGAGTILWNGPLGVFEKPPFDRGTIELARALAGHSSYRVVGGGETVTAVKRAGVADDLDHVSTGGGAMLELLAGKELPGVEVLREAV